MEEEKELNIRLTYQGGNQEQRMQKDKLNTLRKALLYSYQAATAVLSDGREFRCLINPDKLKPDYDNKIVSIPYEDICLNKPRRGTTTEGREPIGLKPGDVFQWKETNSYWLVYLENIEEDAYFRAEIRKCEEEVDINGNKYKIYVRGPVETTIQWNQKKQKVWNDINYSLVIYITKNEETLDYFHRFQTIVINNNKWEIKTVDPYSADGIIEVCLGEWYNNEMEEYIKPDIEPEPPQEEIYIIGPAYAKPYDVLTYDIFGATGGAWQISNDKKAKIIEETSEQVKIRIITGKSGDFNLLYYIPEGQTISYPVTIKSL